MNLDSDFIKADSDNLPRVDVESINDFFAENLQYFGAEMKSEKLKRATKEHYGDNAVSYVQLKREGACCTVKCRITPEHKIHKKAYNVTIVVDEMKEKVLSCECHSCAASSGGCKHAVACLLWLHRRSEEPSVTSTECYWRASKLSKVGSSIKYMTLEEITGKPSTPLKPKDTSLVKSFISRVEKQTGGIFDFHNISKYKQFEMFQLILQYKNLEKNHSVESFITFIKNNMGSDFTEIEKNTREQSSSKLWYEIRFGRITASRVFEAARCKTSDGSLMESIMGACKPLQTAPVSRGKRLEPFVIKRVEELKNIKVSKVGILLNEEFPVFGASPDGITSEYCLEVKCPSREKTVETYLKNNTINQKYFFQLQTQMLFAGKKKDYFA